MYSVAAGEWPEIKAHLLYQQNKPRCSYESATATAS